MTGKPKDHRPKVISFPVSLDGLKIASQPKSILWPCHAFSVSIPQKKKSGLNIFEETVLRLTEIESGDTDEIAGITGLEKELVSFIQSRLNQLELVDYRHNLSKAGLALLDSWRESSDCDVEYVVGTVFVDLLIGKLLPYIHTGDLKHEIISSIKYEYITLEMGSRGKQKPVECIQIRPSKNSFWTIVPDSKGIIKAIREFRKKYKRHALLSQNIDQYPPPVPMAEAISIQSQPEFVYLHCLALSQMGNSDLLVTDGLGYGFSESFANYLVDKDLEWVIDLKSKGVIDRLNRHDDGKNGDSQSKSYKYPEISRRIKNAGTSFSELSSLNVSSTSYERDYKQKIESVIKSLYAGLEWTLRQVVANHPVPQWEQIFANQNYRDNEKILYSFAKKTGLLLTDQNRSILQVKAGAIRQIEKGKVELQPLIALCLAGASHSSTHPFHALSQRHSGFISFALKIKRLRDPIEHGSSDEIQIDLEKLERLKEEVTEMIVSLIPDVAEDLNIGSNKSSTNQYDVNQERLEAGIKLEKTFGQPAVKMMSNDIKEQLTRIEVYMTDCSDDKQMEIIKCMSSAMQLVLLEVITEHLSTEENYTNIKESTFKKVIDVGLCSSIPVAIETVNKDRVLWAVKGSSRESLGANLIALLFLLSDEELLKIKHSIPEIINTIAKMLELRGHGNNQQHFLSRNDLESLKNNVFRVIKIITEIF